MTQSEKQKMKDFKKLENVSKKYIYEKDLILTRIKNTVFYPYLCISTLLVGEINGIQLTEPKESYILIAEKFKKFKKLEINHTEMKDWNVFKYYLETPFQKDEKRRVLRKIIEVYFLIKVKRNVLEYHVIGEFRLERTSKEIFTFKLLDELECFSIINKTSNGKIEKLKEKQNLMS